MVTLLLCHYKGIGQGDAVFVEDALGLFTNSVNLFLFAPVESVLIG